MPQFNPADYDDVKDRLDKFWTAYPNGAISTTLLSDPNNLDTCVFKAEVWKDKEIRGRPDATGHAFENKGQTFKDGANLTHHLENCETSAIGRALADMNYKCKKERPSQQEMEKTTRGIESKPAPKPTPQVAPQATTQVATAPTVDLSAPMGDERKAKVVAKAKEKGYPLPPEFDSYTIAQANALFATIKTFKESA